MSISRYQSYGERRGTDVGTAPTDARYTGQRLDESTGLYFYQSRYYHPGQGRFVQADSIVPDPANPQTLNRFSYCLNNPMRYVDPTGHDPLGPGWEKQFRTEHDGRGPSDLDRIAELRRLIELVRAEYGEDDSRISGTEKFARYVERLAGYYAISETSQFVQALGLLFAGIPYGNPIWGLTLASVNNVVPGHHTLLPDDKYVNPGVGGLYPEYLDTDNPRSNQAHHYIAFLMQGYFQSEAVAVATNWVRDGFFGWIGGRANTGDLELGNVGARHGTALLRDSLAVRYSRLSHQPLPPGVGPDRLAQLMRKDLLNGD